MKGRRFRTIAVGYLHYCAIDAGGVAICWGPNWSGALGNGTTDNSLRPQVVGRYATRSERWGQRLDRGTGAIKHFGVAALALLLVLGLWRDEIARKSTRGVIGLWLISAGLAILLLLAAWSTWATRWSDVFQLLAQQPLFVALGLTIYWIVKRAQGRISP